MNLCSLNLNSCNSQSYHIYPNIRLLTYKKGKVFFYSFNAKSDFIIIITTNHMKGNYGCSTNMQQTYFNYKGLPTGTWNADLDQ